MEREKLLVTSVLFFFICLLISGDGGAEGRRHEEIKKLFVFGDSYADTGNNGRNNSSSWMVPYGISFPGEPDGRWSDGFVLTDHVAKFMKQRTPVAFSSWRNHGAKKLKYGMNFAFGGTGVFDIPDAPYPNMTTQIALFERMLHHNVYTSSDIENSIALVTVSGNDYSSYIAQHPDDYIEGIMAFIPKVVAQLVHNVKSLYNMGVKQVAVAGLQPLGLLGCLPRVTLSNNFTACDTFDNALVQEHNGLLEEAMAKMKNETQKEDYEPLIFLNLYDSFMSIIQHQGLPSENVTFKNPLKACCMGVNASYYCASVEENGTKMYTLCDSPKSTFFWDRVHPTQEGWRAITYLLRRNLTKIRDIRHAY